jgi:hypothetical protein
MLISMLFNNTLFVCMLLVCRFCYQHHLVFEREIKWNHDPWPTFSHKKATFYFICCLLLVFNPKNTKYYLLIPFCFVNLWAVSAWQSLQLVGDANMFTVVGCLKVIESRTTFILWELSEKLLLLHHSAFGVSTSGILKSRFDAINHTPINTNRGSLIILIWATMLRLYMHACSHEISQSPSARVSTPVC